MIESEFKSNIGMFLVCAELSKKNLIVMPTSGNTKGYDVVVLNPKTNKSTGVQVKCSDKKQFPVMSSHWRDYTEKMEEKILCDFVFVDISDISKPRYFVLSDREVKNVLKSNIERYLDKYKEIHKLTSKQEVLEIEEKEKKKAQLWALKLREIENYEGKWETIVNKLSKNDQNLKKIT